MAEATMEYNGAAKWVAIELAVVTFALRRKGHAEGTHDHSPD